MEPAEWTTGQECRRYHVLVNRAARGWASAALERGGSESTPLGVRSLGEVRDTMGADYYALMLNTYRRRLEGQTDAETAPARRVLLYVEQALRIAAAHDERSIPTDELMTGVRWCAKALTAAFEAGFVDAVPTDREHRAPLAATS